MDNREEKWEDRFEQPTDDRIPKRLSPLSPWAYLGYGLLFTLPVVGLVLMIVFALSDGNINRRNYARAGLLMLLISVILIAIFTALVVVPALPRLRDAYSMYRMFGQYI